VRAPTALVFDPSLDSTALRVYLALAAYADKQGKCFPSNGTLAAALGLSVPTVERALRILRRRGLIASHSRGPGRTPIKRVLPPTRAITDDGPSPSPMMATPITDDGGGAITDDGGCHHR
jgi:DNA-binding transcriptional ArsR family regulator